MNNEWSWTLVLEDFIGELANYSAVVPAGWAQIFSFNFMVYSFMILQRYCARVSEFIVDSWCNISISWLLRMRGRTSLSRMSSNLNPNNKPLRALFAQLHSTADEYGSGLKFYASTCEKSSGSFPTADYPFAALLVSWWIFLLSRHSSNPQPSIFPLSDAS